MDWLEIKEFLKDSFKFIIFVIVSLFLFVYVISITQVVGNSMSPTLKNGEVLLLNKAKYRFSTIKRGDIVSLDYADTKYLIKRIIGMPGDSVSIKNSKVYINDELLEETYIPKNLSYKDFELESLGYETIPKDMYFVLGDNRADSLDSREMGLVHKDAINGEIFIRFWPLNKLRWF